MEKELHRTFNEVIHRYRTTLIEYAKKREWEGFKASAGGLFDYCESIEMAETERRFMRVFGIIMAILFLILVIFKIELGLYPELVRLKKVIVISAIAGSSYEFYFFLNFRMYMVYKTACYKKRKEMFIRDIERDFRNTCSL